MFKRILVLSVLVVSALLTGCAAPQQQGGYAQPQYVAPIQSHQGQSQRATSSATTEGRQVNSEKFELKETVLPSTGEQSTCRLRKNGEVLAEIKLPLSTKKEEARGLCNEWQLREAKARGLI